jgi:hypothetical protein
VRANDTVCPHARAQTLYDAPVRALLFAICLFGCKKHQNQDPAPEPPAEPSRGHSVTHFHKDADDSGSASGETAEATPDAHVIGGDGSPAYRDKQGHVHGPGGPVYMGKGPPCDASRDHCMREGVWFAASNLLPGSMFRAVPAFELEGQWYDWRGNDVEPGKLFKTEIATMDKIGAGTPIVFLTPETSGEPWVNSEYDALTTSRWDVGYVTEINPGAKTFRVKGWPDELSIDLARVITQQSSH